MDSYTLSAIEQSKVINKAYNRTKAYVEAEISKILKHTGGEDTLAYEYRMKRLNALLKNTEEKMKELYGINVSDTTTFLKSIIPEAYYHTIFDIAQGVGEQPVFAAVNDKLINAIAKEPWSGENYSKRIWKNTNKLADDVREVLTEAAMSGESINKTSRKLSDAFDTSAYNSQRLIRTETTYACNQAEMASYEALDIDKYRFVATLDTRTSPICQKLDGEVFDTKDAQAGKNLPAMHPNCRSTTIPYFEEGMPEERIARDKDGKRIKVPADMKYDEWYKQYINPEGPPKPGKGNTPPTTQKPPEKQSEKPQAKPEQSKPVDVEIPPPEQKKPEYVDTPIPEKPVEVPKPEARPKAEPEKPTYTPVKTKAEAEEYAHKFAENVNLDGISIENINTILETLTNLTEKYPINKLSELSHRGRGNAVMSACYDDIRINGKKLGKVLDENSEGFKKMQEYTKQQIQELKDRYKGKAKLPPGIATKVKNLEYNLQYSRWAVFDTYENPVQSCLIHEYGHVIADQYFGQINRLRANPHWREPNVRDFENRWNKAFKKAKDTGDIFGLSQYGASNSHEFFAESFAAREHGEKLPDYVESLMKEVLENGIM